VDTADRYRLATPEQVELEYDLGGIGSRFVAVLIDSIIQSVLYVAVILAFVGGAALLDRVTNGRSSQSELLMIVGVALAILLTFVVTWGYFLFFEVVWSGQSPGKRWMGLRVVRADGRPIGFLEALVRNVVRIADFLPFMYVLGVAVMLLNRQARRLGDFAAGTIVVKERRSLSPRALQVPLAAPRAGDELGDAAESLNWAALAPDDYVLVREFLFRRGSLAEGPRRTLAGTLAGGLAVKLGQPAPEDAEAFLERVAAEYRRR
jgi:uncharacterized RDD family membrane protein YckC